MPQTTQTTDIVIKYKGKEYHVPEGFTAAEYAESLATAIPEASNARLIQDAPGVYTLKPLYGEKS